VEKRKLQLRERVDTVLAARGYGEAVRLLRDGGIDTALAAGFTARAHEEMRNDPGIAECSARIGAIVARRLRDGPAWIDALRAQGQAAILASRFHAAQRALTKATKLAVRTSDATLVANLEILRVTPLTHLERHSDAQETARTCLKFFEESKDVAGCVRARMALADLAFRLDQPRVALDHYRKVREMLPAKASPRLRAAVASCQANSLELLHRFRAAERHFSAARELLRDAGCEHTLAQVRYNAAYADAARGRFDAALREFARIEPIFARLGDERHLAHIDLDRAEIHLNLNLAEEASGMAERAARRFKQLGMEKESAQAALFCGRAAELVGDHEAADAAMLAAETIFDELGNKTRRDRCRARRASLARRFGRTEEARELLELAAVGLDEMPDLVARGHINLQRAWLDLDRGDGELALKRARGVLADCHRIHAPGLRIEAERVRGRALAATGNGLAAIDAYREAIEHLETYRAGVPADEYMAAFLAGRSDLYAEIVDLLVEAGQGGPAFEFAERSKSRALVDLIAGGDDPVKSARLTSPRLEHLRKRLNAIYHRIHHGGTDDARGTRMVEHARRRASALEQEVAHLLRETRLRDREAASLTSVERCGLDSIRADLEPDTVLVEYFVSAQRLYAFVVTPTHVHVRRQEIPKEELASLVGMFRFHISRFCRGASAATPLAERATRANLQALADHLLEPLREFLDAKRLVIVPHGFLHEVPFHALPWGDGDLIDKFEVVYAPSAAVYGHCRRHARADGPAGVFALPDEAAPQIEHEGRRVAELLGSDRLYLREDATLGQLREEARTARFLHVATHGMFRPERPMLSCIRLADTWLNLYDIYGLEVSSELVVLSTCESGTAGVTDGNEILGLTRGFLFAGAPAILASQWRVDDVATQTFMEALYEALMEGRDAAAASRAAMLAVRAEHKHPYYWAPFFLTGRPIPQRDKTRQKDKTASGMTATCKRGTR